MAAAIITGTGLWTPTAVITNEELVDSFNTFVRSYNDRNAAAIASGELPELSESSAAFIEKASGVKQRYVVERDGVLDIRRMRPKVEPRGDDELSLQAEIGVAAARQALEQAGRTPEEVDCVIMACANAQRAYPAVSIEIQNALGIDGYAYDMNVACSSATFGIQQAVGAIAAGSARCVLVVSPEITSAHLNFKDRDSHFIFGDVCTAAVVEAPGEHKSDDAYEILSTKLTTRFSNAIRNNFGFLNRVEDNDPDDPDKLFRQQGRKVFKEVAPMVVRLLNEHMEDNGLSAAEMRRLWLHQANLNMNQHIATKLLGRPATDEEAPTILDEYANTASAGSIIAFHKHRADIKPGDHGVICSFGAGYSIGSILVRKQ